MISLSSLLWLSTTLISAHNDTLFSANAQTMGGYSHTPFVLGPGTEPLLNAPVNSGQYVLDVILTPGVQFTSKAHEAFLTLSYKPRIFFNMLGLFSTTPTVFHRVDAQSILGDPKSWVLTLGANVSVGGLDYGSTGATLQEFSASLQPQANVSAFNYLSLGALAKIERSFERWWKATSTATVNKLELPASQAQQYLSNYINTTNDTGFNNFSAAATLQEEDRASTVNELRYKFNDDDSAYIVGEATVGRFPGVATYPYVSPRIGWQGLLTQSTRMTLEGGTLRFWTNPYPGVDWHGQWLAVFKLSLTHTFASWGLPRLVGGLELSEGPYFDLIDGLLTPRAMGILDMTYTFNRFVVATLQLRDYTQEYYDGKNWWPIKKGHDKNVLVLNMKMTYVYSRWLSYQGGVFGSNRWIEPSGTLAYNQLQDIYFFIGVTGQYDVE